MTATRLQRPTARGRAVAAGGCAAVAACAALLLAGTPPAAAVEYYRSDAHGTRLARLDGDPASHPEYALAVDAAGEAQAAGLAARRRLLRAGTVVTEWRRSADGDGSVERELQAGQVVAERRYDDAGRLLEESHFAAAGDLLRRAVLIYRGATLRRIQRYDGGGELTATEDYELTSSGRLRGFSHTPADPSGTADPARSADPAGTAVVHFLFHQGELVEERRRAGQAEVILRFRGGEQLAAEQWRGEQLVTARSAGARIDHRRGTRTETTVDGAGRVETERVYDIAGGEDAARLLEERSYRYRDDGTVRSLQVIGQSGRETVDYEFGDHGRLLREQVRRRGRLVRVVSYPSPGERVEEVHGADNTVLRVIWRDDQPIREELVSDGEVVRSRDLAPGAAPGGGSAPAPGAGTS